jgi:hypothetical protein
MKMIISDVCKAEKFLHTASHIFQIDYGDEIIALNNMWWKYIQIQKVE